LQTTELVEFALNKMDDMKARDVVKLDVIGKSPITDYLLICSGNSKRHVLSIADNVNKEAKAAGFEPLSFEGRETGEWVIVDLGDVIVHVMQEQTRDFYQLEKLWG
jgi:ribosome-associated protein